LEPLKASAPLPNRQASATPSNNRGREIRVTTTKGKRAEQALHAPVASEKLPDGGDVDVSHREYSGS
jgi:hypothetical protein